MIYINFAGLIGWSRQLIKIICSFGGLIDVHIWASGPVGIRGVVVENKVISNEFQEIIMSALGWLIKSWPFFDAPTNYFEKRSLEGIEHWSEIIGRYWFHQRILNCFQNCSEINHSTIQEKALPICLVLNEIKILWKKLIPEISIILQLPKDLRQLLNEIFCQTLSLSKKSINY